MIVRYSSYEELLHVNSFGPKMRISMFRWENGVVVPPRNFNLTATQDSNPSSYPSGDHKDLRYIFVEHLDRMDQRDMAFLLTLIYDVPRKFRFISLFSSPINKSILPVHKYSTLPYSLLIRPKCNSDYKCNPFSLQKVSPMALSTTNRRRLSLVRLL